MSATARPRRFTPVMIGVLTAAALVMVGTLVVITGDDRPRAEVGDVVLGPGVNNEEGEATEVLLPWARMEVTIGEPLDELPADLDERPELLRPPAGGSFIRVAIEPAADYWTTLFRVDESHEGTASAVLTAGGRDYPLSPVAFPLDTDSEFLGFGGEAWVAVDGKPTDASLAITAEGLTQVIADGLVKAGRAGELGDVPSEEELDEAPTLACGPPISRATSGLTLRNMSLVDCRRGAAVRTPFVLGLGWAEEGRDFLVVNVEIYEEGIGVSDESGVWWRRRDPRLDATLDGQAAVGTGVEPWLGDPSSPTQFVFDVPSDTTAGDLDLTYTFEAETADPFLSDRRPVEVQWRVASGDPR